MKITKEFTFDAAHFLPNYNGKCENMHGHTYKMQVTIEAPVNPKDGMAFDFCEIKKIVNEKVIEKLDHTLINDLLKIPSAEYIAIWSWNQLKDTLPLFEIKVWESPTNFVIYMGEDEEILD